MRRKTALTILSCFLFIGLTFVAAKVRPCYAQVNTCETETFEEGQAIPISDYSTAAVQEALSQHKRVVLFFQASWCSTCHLIEKDMQQRAAEIPADLVIFRVSIDTEKKLMAKYGVVAQDELVQINAAGNEVSHWKSSERAVEELLIHVK